MKFLNYLLLFALCLPAFAVAQMVTVSEEISIRNYNSYDIIGKMNDRFLLYREQANKVEIQAFDSRMRQSWDKELKFDHKRFEVVGMVPDRNKFSIVYHYRKKGDDFLRVQQYDGAANMTDSATIITYKHSFGDPAHRMIYSEDRTKILIYTIKNQKDVSILSYDLTSRSILWEAEFELDDSSFFKEHLEMLVTDRGVMYLMMGKDNRKSKMEEHRYLIYRCGQTSNAIELFQLPMNNKLTYSILFDYDNRNQVLVAGGLYSEKNLNRCDGHFTARLPANNLANSLQSYIPFNTQLISDLEGKIVTDFKGMENVRIQDIVLRKDGGMLLMFERTKEYERRMASSGRGMVGSDGLRYIVDYYYDNVFIMAIHPNGQKHWEQILHKKQYSQDDNAIFSSYFILKTPSALRLLFNDDIKQESTVSEYVINSLGEYDRNSVMSTENQDIRLRFRDAVQVASNEIVVPSERRNRLKLVRVIF